MPTAARASLTAESTATTEPGAIGASQQRQGRWQQQGRNNRDVSSSGDAATYWS